MQTKVSPGPRCSACWKHRADLADARLVVAELLRDAGRGTVALEPSARRGDRSQPAEGELEDGGPPRDPANLMSVCRSHHSVIHAQSRRGVMEGRA